MQQSAKESCLLKRNTVSEVFPLTAILAGSGKTMPFEKRHVGCEEREKINRRRIFDTLRINFFEATKQTACIFSKGDGNMTRKMSTTNLPGASGNAYPNAELDYSLDYEYDPAYAHRLVHAGNRYYRYDANGNITAEKDGPFTEDDEFIFTYSYDPDTDVYSADYGFGLDSPKETEETHPENLFAYRRNYTWNEKNLLTKSSDRSYTVHYRYGEDGQRALKYTEEGRSETLYFNNFYTIHIPVRDKNNPQGLRVHKHIFVGNSRLVTAMTHTDNNGDNAEQREKRYYYHSDHLGSAQFVTDWRGKQYEHIEYTPYGELWIEEVAAGLDKLPFRFTGKEMDEETGLYYYGARYLDPKYSRWLSGDPALSDYIPKAPIDDEAKKHNENLPGMGGVFNVVNLHLYHYAGNNPVKYTDPDGKFDVVPYHISNFQVVGPKLQKFTGIPLGGGYLQDQKDLYKVADMLQALIGASSLGEYQTLASLPTSDLKEILIETSKSVVGTIAKSAEKVFSIADLPKALFSTPEAKAQNYTKREKEFLMMVVIEQSFISDLSKKLLEKGFPVQEKKDRNSNFIMNITITSFSEYATSGISAKDAIIFIANEVKASNELYKNIKINE